MKGVRQSWLVAGREIRERGRSRGFLLSVVLMLIAVAAAIALPALLDTGPGTKDIGLTGSIPDGTACRPRSSRRRGRHHDPHPPL